MQEAISLLFLGGVISWKCMQTCVFDVICWEIYGPIVRWADRRNNPLKVAQFSSLHFLPGFKSLLLTSYSVVCSSQKENCRRLTSRHPFPSFSLSFQFSPFLHIFPPYVSSSVHKVSIFYIHLGWQGALWISTQVSRVSFLTYQRNNPYWKLLNFWVSTQVFNVVRSLSASAERRCEIKVSFVEKRGSNIRSRCQVVRIALQACQLIWDQLLSNHFPLN